MDDVPPVLLQGVLLGEAMQIWSMLAEDSGCSLTVFDDRGRIAWANDRTLIDLEWHLRVLYPEGSGEQLDPIGKSLDEIVPKEFGIERMGFVRHVLKSGRTIVYESVLRGVRQRVCVRRLGTSPGPLLAVIVARRLRASERVADLVPRDAELVHPRIRDAGPLSVLSDREMEVLKLVGEGLSSAQIALRLHRSARTVEGHRKAIGAKLGISKGVDLVRVAIRAGLCELPDSPDAL